MDGVGAVAAGPFVQSPVCGVADGPGVPQAHPGEDLRLPPSAVVAEIPRFEWVDKQWGSVEGSVAGDVDLRDPSV